MRPEAIQVVRLKPGQRLTAAEAELIRKVIAVDGAVIKDCFGHIDRQPTDQEIAR